MSAGNLWRQSALEIGGYPGEQLDEYENEISDRCGIAGLPGDAGACRQLLVVQDATTKKCTVVSQKPTTTTTTVVGDGKVYTTQTEAESAMKSVTVCQSK